jgi:Fe-S-cluster formation regulator IscX/YfhJ
LVSALEEDRHLSTAGERGRTVCERRWGSDQKPRTQTGSALGRATAFRRESRMLGLHLLARPQLLILPIVNMRTGLYEYLAVAVSPNFSGGTRVTATTGETYDDDPGVGGLGVSVDQASKITKNDAETYDDDPGVGGLGLWLGVGTVITRQNAETYDDDPGLAPLTVPMTQSTRTTFVDAETFDDDPGSYGLGLL